MAKVNMPYQLKTVIIIFSLGIFLTPVLGLPNIDGVVSQGEYDSSSTFGDGRLSVYWSISGGEIYLAFKGETKGWISIGFEPSRIMKDADMIICWVSGGTSSVIDAYSTGLTGPHPPDTDLGGTDDILSHQGSEENGFTTIEVKRKLTTDDQYDKTIQTGGSINIIWALGKSDGGSKKHTSAGSGVLSMAINEHLPSIASLPLLAYFLKRKWLGA